MTHDRQCRVARLKLNRIILSNTREHAFFYVRVRTTIVKNYITAKYFGKILKYSRFLKVGLFWCILNEN